MSEIAAAEQHKDLIDGCTATPIGRVALGLAAEAGALESPRALREEMHTQLTELVDAYDSMDHRLVPRGSETQDDCQDLRELVRSFR